MVSPPNSTKVIVAFGILAFGVLAFSGSVCAQQGITPSLNGLFFDDFRARSLDAERPSTHSQGRPSYRFHRGYYRSLGPTASQSRESLDHRSKGRGLGQPFPEGDLYSHSQRYGREFGRYSSPTFGRDQLFAGPYVTDGFSNGHRNFKIGPIPFKVGLSADLEYNDNLTRTKTNKASTLIAGVNARINGTYNITRWNRLSIGGGIGYDYYFDHPELSSYGQWSDSGGLNIPLGSGFSFDVLAGDLVITFYDQFSTQSVTQDDFALDDLDIFSQFVNQAGVSTNWAINSSLNFSLGYQRSDRIAFDDEFDFLDYGQHTLRASLAWSPTQTWTAGINGSSNWVGYSGNVQNDGETYSVGAFFSSPITHNTSIRAGAGVQIFEFDEGGTNGDRSDLSDEYYNVSLQNQLNARVSHSITLGHESSLGTRSNFVTTDYIRYGVGVIGYRGSRYSASIFYEEEQSSGGFSAENFERYGVDLYAGHQITDWLHMGLGYHYGNTESSIAGRDYEQHSFSIDTSYPLTPNVNMGVGYRFWTVSAEDSAADFDQNRVILNLNYRF